MIDIDVSELVALEKGLARYESVLPRSVAGSALRTAAKPMYQAARAGVPVGKKGNVQTGALARGGATRRDMRMKIVSGTQHGEVARVLIGVSKKTGKVGWRTHFITRGFTDRSGKKHGPNDFLKVAFDATIITVQSTFGKLMALSFQKWARNNLPQGKF